MSGNSKFNKDELVPPSFLNDQFVVDIIKSAEEDPAIQLIRHEITPGSAAGDHYASIMFKIIATYEVSGRTVTDRRFILKTIPESGEKRDFLNELPLFANEIKMFTQTLPALEEIYTKHGDRLVWPKLVFHIEDPIVLVFDDLTQEDYGMLYEPLGFDNIQMIIEKIAQYHAASMVLAKQPGQLEVLSQYRSTLDGENVRGMFKPMVAQGKTMAAAAKNWPGCKEIAEKLEKNMDNIFENFMKSYALTNTWGFNVLNHGDFHIRNMMFATAGETIKDVIFLDFQLPMYHSPAFDLIYMMNAIGSREVRERRMEVVNVYHKELVRNLSRYGFAGTLPSIIDVHVGILNLGSFDAFQTLTFMPTLRIDLRGVEMSDIFNKTGDNPLLPVYQKMYEEPAFVEEMSRLLVNLDSLNLLD